MPTLKDLFHKLSREQKLKSRTAQEFGDRAGYYMNELNAVHPFREGNGRVQREFIRELGLHAGLHVDWTQISRDEMYSASVSGFQTGDCRPIAALIMRITTKTAE